MADGFAFLWSHVRAHLGKRRSRFAAIPRDCPDLPPDSLHPRAASAEPFVGCRGGSSTRTQRIGVTEVRLLYFDGCPNVRTLHDRVLAALLDEGLGNVKPVLEKVASPGDAERLRFAGSPTILIDGSDPFAEEGAPFGFWCRLYVTPNGLEGSPTSGQLRSALRSA